MASTALVAQLVWAAIAFGLRSAIHRRRTGASGIVLRPPANGGRSARAASALLLMGMLLTPVGTIADLCGIESWWDTRTFAARSAAAALYFAGLVGTFACQLSMRDSWRIGVDPASRTALVTNGPYRWTRNPIYAFVMLSSLSFFAATPNAISLAALASIVLGFELQVRRVEEPYLASVHGETFRAWAARTGRFVPFIGKLV